MPTTFPRPQHINQRLEHSAQTTFHLASLPSDCRATIKDMNDDVDPDQMDDLNHVLGRIVKNAREDAD